MSKAIDKAAGAERDVIGHHPLHRAGGHLQNGGENTRPWQAAALEAGHGGDLTAPATPEAARWQGWGTALKPGWEIIVVARKPLVSTVAANILQYGTGALNIDACRIEARDSQLAEKYASVQNAGKRNNTIYGIDSRDRAGAAPHTADRWPANVVLDEDAATELDQQSGEVRSSHHAVESVGAEGTTEIGPVGLRQGRAMPGINTYSDHGGASRFFFIARKDAPARHGCVLRGMLSICESANGAAARQPIPDTVRGPVPVSPRPHGEGSEDRSPDLASTAALSSPATDELTAAIALLNVPTKRASSLVRSAASAVNLCDSCVTAIVRSGALTLQERPDLSPLGLASTHNSNAAILNRSLALVAEDLVRCGTTSTTTDLTTSLGCAVDAISTYITRASRHDSSGSGRSVPASQQRMSYTAKASTDERIHHNGVSHATVKPLSLMRWLVKLVTQPGGVVLDPFAGSGTTVEACVLEGFRCIAVEREADYLPLITQRINRRLDPVAYLEAAGDDLGLFGEIA